jgi:hypothetical protein
MALLDLLKKSPDQLTDKQVQQLIAFAGAGKLIDESDCSIEFRAFLGNVSSSNLQNYADQCLNQTFTDSGLALQDVVNEIGARLGAEVTPGRYRGTVKHLGFDGLWKFANAHSIVTEVKTTDTYRIDLNTIADYRKALIDIGTIGNEETSSMLLVVGRQDTGDLEAQIRGSRYAWDVRIISVDALLRLLSIKEEVEDPQIIQRIHNILVPREFTRLDEIVDVLFSTTEDIRQEEGAVVEQVAPVDKKSKEPKFTPVAFHDACMARIQTYLKETLIKRTVRSPRNTTPTPPLIIGLRFIHTSVRSSDRYQKPSWHSGAEAANEFFSSRFLSSGSGLKDCGLRRRKIGITGTLLSTVKMRSTRCTGRRARRALI